MKTFVEHVFNGPTTPITSYDSTKTNLGRTIVQDSNAIPPYAGPLKIGITRPVETSAAIPGMMPCVVTKDSNTDYVYLADNAAAAATRRVSLYDYSKQTGNYSWKGFVTLNFPFFGTQGTYTVRGSHVDHITYSTGTVSVSGTAVTGSCLLYTSDAADD